MDIESIRNYCIGKKATTESFPFDESTLVFKVAGKMYALVNLENQPLRISLKCEPEKAIDLRERHFSILPGYHLNKKHWNTIELDGTLPPKLIEELIDHSYQLVISKLTKKVIQENNLER